MDVSTVIVMLLVALFRSPSESVATVDVPVSTLYLTMVTVGIPSIN